MSSLTPEEEGRALEELRRFEATFAANGFLTTDEMNVLEMVLLRLPRGSVRTLVENLRMRVREQS